MRRIEFILSLIGEFLLLIVPILILRGNENAEWGMLPNGFVPGESTTEKPIAIVCLVLVIIAIILSFRMKRNVGTSSKWILIISVIYLILMCFVMLPPAQQPIMTLGLALSMVASGVGIGKARNNSL